MMNCKFIALAQCCDKWWLGCYYFDSGPRGVGPLLNRSCVTVKSVCPLVALLLCRCVCDRGSTTMASPDSIDASDKVRYPAYKRMSPANVERFAEFTAQGHYKLLRAELFWKEQQPVLLAHGYMLRARFRPSWTPTWLGTNIHPYFCEDSRHHRVSQIGTLCIISLLQRLSVLCSLIKLLTLSVWKMESWSLSSEFDCDHTKP